MIREPERTGFLVRVWRIYREKRRPQRHVVYRDWQGETLVWNAPPQSCKRALRIAWKQARNARGM